MRLVKNAVRRGLTVAIDEARACRRTGVVEGAMADEIEPRRKVAMYAIRAALAAIKGEKSYNPSVIAENLSKLRLELDRMPPSRHVPDAANRLEQVKRHVSNLVAAASDGVPPGGPELWTLSIALDYLADHLVVMLEKNIREQLQLEAELKSRA